MENINSMVINKKYFIGGHAAKRAVETGLKGDKLDLAVSLAATGTIEEGRNGNGKVWIMRKVLKNGRELRVVAGENKFDSKKLFIVSMFLCDEGDNSIGKHFNKFGGEVVYNFG